MAEVLRTMHWLPLTLQTLGFFLQFGLTPGHQLNHMVKKTTKPSKDKDLLETKGEVFVGVWVGGFNYWIYVSE